MKIKNVRIRHVSGTMPTEGTFWEDRLVRPVDIYPEHRTAPCRCTCRGRGRLIRLLG